ncbi:MerR family transcriptional regulator [Pseudonocardia charpentierae]|uniref:MerR, DNA binding n=1 Tax=Pseudonocardia charpentierae TaxID=3075545 RepID=A0ABU2NGU2_9PSEU|nr:hypothetical protein [Pseudonocardia sp. DSM 45834]MDT0353175.1 hypothetical protein [Pseudonocardia sp. DSM 45834]
MELLDTFVEHGGTWTADDRVAFLGRRREEMLDRLQRTRAALQVLDDKIAYYSRD